MVPASLPPAWSSVLQSAAEPAHLWPLVAAFCLPQLRQAHEAAVRARHRDGPCSVPAQDGTGFGFGLGWRHWAGTGLAAAGQTRADPCTCTTRSVAPSSAFRGRPSRPSILAAEGAAALDTALRAATLLAVGRTGSGKLWQARNQTSLAPPNIQSCLEDPTGGTEPGGALEELVNAACFPHSASATRCG